MASMQANVKVLPSSLFSRRAKTFRTNFHKIRSTSVIGSPPGKQRRPVWQYDLAAMRLMWHCRRLCPEPGDLFHIPAHNLEPRATLGRSFDHALDVPHPFGKVHLFAKGAQVRVDLRVLKVHFLADIVEQSRIERSVEGERGHHIPVAEHLQNISSLLLA